MGHTFRPDLTEWDGLFAPMPEFAQVMRVDRWRKGRTAEAALCSRLLVNLTPLEGSPWNSPSTGV